ncbi:DUF2919 family protein [Alteromonas facilis]|uniref:DUF2919 family protein n=1 Tax=Alteromonas facilis TaxID=2048004 RepID=UPI000C28F0D9|nr:DUF2919 family protein [Alteromonas facilis]
MSTPSRLPFPLHCYDESGHLKPPLLMYVACIWLAKALLLMIISVSMRENPSALIELYYPSSHEWYVNIVPAMPGIAVFILLGGREKLRKQPICWQCFTRTILLLGLLLSLIIQAKGIWDNHGYFSWRLSVSVLLTLTFVVYLSRSKRVGAYVRDASVE